MLSMISWLIRISSSAGTSPVSYTHLDVYKRQHFALRAVPSLLVPIFPYTTSILSDGHFRYLEKITIIVVNTKSAITVIRMTTPTSIPAFMDRSTPFSNKIPAGQPAALSPQACAAPTGRCLSMPPPPLWWRLQGRKRTPASLWKAALFLRLQRPVPPARWKEEG